ncbi:DUF4145 domain-containing protein [Bacillus sp. JJ1562]|uniref:DUF4145 domain-containing protein n=1 Tax=Bacillus sp. JJ1562 TaxID=3122960 RepID=UPI00300207C6
MKTSVFHFIGEFSCQLEELALRVEALLWDQPQAAMTQARLFGELFVNMIFEQENMSEVYPLKLVEKINRLFRHDVIDDDIYKKLEFIRKNGNIASHQVLEMDQEVAKEVHRTIFDLGVWYAEVYVSHTFSAPSYELPSKQSQDLDAMKQWMDEYIKETQARISEIEEQLSQLKEEKKQHPIVKEKRNPILDQPKNKGRQVPLEKFQSTFRKAGFNYRGQTKKAAEFQFENFKTGYVYLLDNATPTIAIHPWLVGQAKLFDEEQTKSRKSTALKNFPRMKENDQLKSNYGYAFTFQTNGELEVLLQRIAEEFETKYMIK